MASGGSGVGMLEGCAVVTVWAGLIWLVVGPVLGCWKAVL
jgi:hypothetical protein